MQAYGGNKAAEQYLAQRVMGASPELLAAMLLEGAQKFLGLGVNAIKTRDFAAKARHLCRATDIVDELVSWLNMEEGPEVALNLARIFDWWLREIYDASRADDTARLERVARQMGEIRSAWEELNRRNSTSTAAKPAGQPMASSLDGICT